MIFDLPEIELTQPCHKLKETTSLKEIQQQNGTSVFRFTSVISISVYSILAYLINSAT